MAALYRAPYWPDAIGHPVTPDAAAGEPERGLECIGVGQALQRLDRDAGPAPEIVDADEARIGARRDDRCAILVCEAARQAQAEPHRVAIRAGDGFHGAVPAGSIDVDRAHLDAIGDPRRQRHQPTCTGASAP